MSDTITIHGASGSTVTLQGGTNAELTNNLVIPTQKFINDLIENDYAEAFEIAPNKPVIFGQKIAVGIIQDPIPVEISGYSYIVVADSDNASTTDNDVIISTRNNNNTTNIENTDLTILSGRRSGLAFLPGNHSGRVINTVGDLNFDSNGKTGNWEVFTDAGNHTIRTGTGKNTVSILGDGISSIYSQGQDMINIIDTPYTAANITLAGDNSTVSAGQIGTVTDLSNNNQITASNNTTVNAGNNGTIDFKTSNTDSSLIGNNMIQGGTGNTISSTNSNITAIHGDSNNFNKLTDNLTFLNGYGDTNVTVEKQFVGFGASNLNLTLKNDVNNANSSLFVADQGNETLNASGYANKIEIYASTVTGSESNFVATGGAGDDVLAAGTGNASFTGGAGNNLFMFTKEVISNGTTVITDFANQNSDNHIGLYDYGFNQDSIAQLLKDSHNDDKGNALLNLDNHKITIEGVSVADLKSSQFLA